MPPLFFDNPLFVDNPYQINDAHTYSVPKVITQEDINDLINKLYSIISEHTKIDITEEEFMSIIKGEKYEQDY